jgi:S-adenosylmethionine-diacylgycerolhomoserine-N-methlytransferase
MLMLNALRRPQHERIQGFYRRQAKFYESTRWSFLFGRKDVIKRLKLSSFNHLHLLEVGCGTGHNLKKLAQQHPNMRLTGLDVSDDMLTIAAQKVPSNNGKVVLQKADYMAEGNIPGRINPDIILISYVLTMMNPGWEAAISKAWEDLPLGGRIAIVDFNDTPVGAFKRWMAYNHVRMDGHLLPFLQARFKTVFFQKKRAYGGLWNYFVFVGVKSTPETEQ